MTSNYRLPDIYDDRASIERPQVTTEQFSYDREKQTFYSDGEKLLLKENEYFIFFAMRGKTQSHCFVWASRVINNGAVVDLYWCTTGEYKAEITRKLPIDKNSIIV